MAVQNQKEIVSREINYGRKFELCKLVATTALSLFWQYPNYASMQKGKEQNLTSFIEL